MATFVVETYLSRASEAGPDPTIRRAQASADAALVAGDPVRYVRSMFMPADETLLLVFEADSVDVVRAVTVRAGIDADRILMTESHER